MRIRVLPLVNFNWIDKVVKIIFPTCVAVLLTVLTHVQALNAQEANSRGKTVILGGNCESTHELAQNHAKPSDSLRSPTQPDLSGWVDYPGYYAPRGAYGPDAANPAQASRADSLMRETETKRVIIPEPTLDDFRALATLPNLEHLEVSVPYIDPVALHLLRSSKTLKRLIIFTGSNSSHPLPTILGLPNVEVIELNVISDFVVSENSKSPEQRPPINAEEIPKDENITCLRLVGASVSNTSSLRRMKGLQFLQLNTHTLPGSEYKTLESLFLRELGIFVEKPNSQAFVSNLSACPTNRVSVINPTVEMVAALSRRVNASSIETKNIYEGVVLSADSLNKQIRLAGGLDTLKPSFLELLSLNPQTEDLVLAMDPREPTKSPLLKTMMAAGVQLPMLNRLSGVDTYPEGIDDGTADYIAKKLSHLKEVDLLLPQHHAARSLRRLCGLQELESISVSFSDFGNDSVADLLQFPHLKKLDARRTALGAAATQPLTKLPLEHLNLSYTGVSDQDSEYFEKMKQLKFLNLASTGVGDKALAAIGELRNLEELDLSHTKITGKGLSFLKKLKGLRNLNLEGTAISGLDPALFGEMSELEKLNLGSTDIKSEDIDAILRSSASELDLSRTWLGADSSLSLSKMKNLKKINLTDVATDSHMFAPQVAVMVSSNEHFTFSEKKEAWSTELQEEYSSKWKSWKSKNWNALVGKNDEAAAEPKGKDWRPSIYFCGNAAMAAADEKRNQRFFRGVGSLGKSKFNDAINAFDLCLESWQVDGSSLVHAYRGLCYLKTGNFERARIDLDRAISWEPTFSEAYAFRSELFEKLGEYDHAKSDREIALKLGYQPEFPCAISFWNARKKPRN